jgi:preprotein translocase subunit SecY
MKLFSTLQNIWSIKELKDRILYTIALVAVFRIGSAVVVPGVVKDTLAKSMSSGSNDLLSLINNFSGGAFSQAAVFALGVMPYITASIIIQILGFAVPYFQRLQMKEGESGRKKLNQFTRFLTVAISLVQAGAYLQLVKGMEGAVDFANIPEPVWWFCNLVILTSGTIFCMWLGERITDKGLGNGISLIIMAGIISRLPFAFGAEFQSMFRDNKLMLFLVEIAALFVVTLLTILIIQGVRRIPLQYAKRMVGRGGAEMPGSGNRDYLPMKVNSAGVMPIIFAQAIMFLPASIYSFFKGEQASGALTDIYGFWYNFLFFVLVVVFTFVYTALMINPNQQAEFLKRTNAFIPGVKPGEETASFIDTVMTRITLPGAIFLALIGILPAFARMAGVNNEFALFFGGTTLLIMVGVVLDTLQVIESYLLMRRYDGLTQSGQIQGRATNFQVDGGY